MENPGTDGNLYVMNIQKLDTRSFLWKLLENMTKRFPHIPAFAWISQIWKLQSEANAPIHFKDQSTMALLIQC